MCFISQIRNRWDEFIFSISIKLFSVVSLSFLSVGFSVSGVEFIVILNHFCRDENRSRIRRWTKFHRERLWQDTRNTWQQSKGPIKNWLTMKLLGWVFILNSHGNNSVVTVAMVFRSCIVWWPLIGSGSLRQRYTILSTSASADDDWCNDALALQLSLLAASNGECRIRGVFIIKYEQNTRHFSVMKRHDVQRTSLPALQSGLGDLLGYYYHLLTNQSLKNMFPYIINVTQFKIIGQLWWIPRVLFTILSYE